MTDSPSTNDSLSALKFYVDLANAEKQAIWARHATMVVGNSLLINAVASELHLGIGFTLSLAGLFLCVLWGIMTWVGWSWFYKSIIDAKKLPVHPLLNPFSSFPHKGEGDRHSDTIFKCTMAIIIIFGLVYIVQLLKPFYKVV